MSVEEDRREFFRVIHKTPLKFKIYKGDKLSKKAEIVSKNISPSGLLFRTYSELDIPPIGSMVWVQLDDKMLNICEEIENDLIMKDEGLFGRVVRISEGEPGKSYDIGVCFLRRQNMDDSDIETLMG